MRTLGNFLWIILGGWIIAVEYVISSIILMITIVGIPFGLQTLKLADLSLWPFGRDTRTTQSASGCLSVIMNFIWIVVGGFWIFVTHMILALLCALTIVGIPFARQHIKLAALAFTPFGREVFTK
ncbi:MAG TPA: YccF domain-containing protein [Prolixibacteraceae bacterium]|nr:YccF domain-containing protein [Prolixibacteraceae bacterium]